MYKTNRNGRKKTQLIYTHATQVNEEGAIIARPTLNTYMYSVCTMRDGRQILDRS